MPPYLNPLKRSAEPEEASWSPRKRQYSASEQEEYWIVMWSVYSTVSGEQKVVI